MKDAFELTPALFSILTALVEERTGIHYGVEDKSIFTSKLAARASDAGFDSPLDYYYFLRYDAGAKAELDALIDALVVNETYFHREADQLAVLCDDLLATRVREGRRPRVWCAAASTGEEPLSLAIMLAERGLSGSVEIVASDISQRALARAKEGLYGSRALRALPPAWRARWMEEDGDRVRVRDEIRKTIEWRRVNLLEASATMAGETFDAIICRNVLIYFGDATVMQVVHSLASFLASDGLLLIGASESLLRLGTLFTCHERRGCFFYARGS